MLRHAYVPKSFQRGFMIPLIKDQQGNHSDLSNYRGITISPIASKIFEHVLKNKFQDHLLTSSQQFGFKPKHSTSHAVYCLKMTINYYVNNNSRVFCSFLDASKAFDRLVHSGLFLKLMERNVPKLFLDVIVTWYSDLQCQVKWGETMSDWFTLTAGVRQGGVLSPAFYSIYTDGLIQILKSKGIGCYIRNNFAAAIFYADDMALIAPSIKGLQSLIDCCAEYCSAWDICLNPKKTINMAFGKKINSMAEVTLN